MLTINDDFRLSAPLTEQIFDHIQDEESEIEIGIEIYTQLH